MNKEFLALKRFYGAVSQQTLELVSADGPAGLLGAQVALIILILRGLLGIAGLTLLCLMVRFSHKPSGLIAARNTVDRLKAPPKWVASRLGCS